jgi:hypothetical protein
MKQRISVYSGGNKLDLRYSGFDPSTAKICLFPSFFAYLNGGKSPGEDTGTVKKKTGILGTVQVNCVKSSTRGHVVWGPA